MTLADQVKEAYMSRKARADVLYTLWQQMSHLNTVDEQVKLAEALIADIRSCIEQLRHGARLPHGKAKTATVTPIVKSGPAGDGGLRHPGRGSRPPDRGPDPA